MEKKSRSVSKTETPAEKSSGEHDFLVVGIGASAGGIKALQEFFSTMPPNSGMAFVVILHLSPEHESSLAEIIQAQTAMPVTQVNETHKVEPNNVYVIPPNRQLEMVDGVVRCTKPADGRGRRVAIDTFFRTLADGYERNAVCVVMSGTGSDGTLGLKRIKEANGFAIVQDPQDAEYEQMPRSAINTQLADWILPVKKMPEKLIDFRESSERLHLTDGDDGKVAREINADESLREILTLLRVRTGHDFSNYKTPTLVRRIARHLQIHDLEDIPAYLNLLRGKPEEINFLLKNLLINVTNFFRDKDAWDALERDVIPNLFEGKAGDTVRVWSAGCASGEEAYSLAMLLTERAERLSDPPQIQVFATDVDEDAVGEAREHLYPRSIEADVSPARLKRFFVREGDYYRVKKEIRELVLFAPHNVLRDPPFSRLDLIACRNLLIYLNRETQERLMEIFHFALAPHGFLFLGSSETAESVPKLFDTVNKKQRIYSRRSLPLTNFDPPRMPISGKWRVNIPETKVRSEPETAFSLGEIHYKLLEKFAPPSILVNQDFEVQYMSESAGRYLQFKGGELRNNLLKLINSDLLPDLRAALFSEQRERSVTEHKDIRAVIGGKETKVSIIVRAVDVESEAGDFLLVIFDENSDYKIPKDVGKKTAIAPVKDGAAETIVRRLEAELLRTKQNLRTTIEQHEVSIEELKASNEELQAINEELRSASEELETSKEELQSVNEELTTVNHELKEKIEETSRANSDLRNLISSTDIATIFLDRTLRIRRITPPVEKLFNITPEDTGRPLEHFTHKLVYENVMEDAAQVMQSLLPLEREISGKDRRFYIVRFLPYRTIEDKIDGIVINFLDITERKRAEELLQKSEAMWRAAFEVEAIGVIFIKTSGEITNANDTFLQMSGYSRRDLEKGSVRWDKMTPPEFMPRSLEAIAEFEKTGRISTYEKQYIRKNGSRFWALFTGSKISDDEGVEFVLDVTDRREIEDALRRSEENLKLILESTKDYAIITFDLDGRITRWNKGAEKIFGWKEKEAVGQSGEMIFTPEDRAAQAPEKEMAKAIKKGRAEDERWHLRKDGSRIYVSGMMQPLRDGDLRGFVKIARDQTEKIKAETALREKHSLQQFVRTQEDERRRIARDIHDQLGQQLTALRFKVNSLDKMFETGDLSDKKKAAAQITELQKIIEQLDRDIDFLAWELRPASLDDLGLRLTLQNFVKEWAKYTGIKTDFHTSGLGKVNLSGEIETNLYRIAQEALNNILKHAKARNVSVLLEKRKDAVVLIIEDDGIGFNVKKKLHRPKGLGLVGMKERAELMGGNFEIESAPKKGTTVFVRAPLKTE